MTKKKKNQEVKGKPENPFSIESHYQFYLKTVGWKEEDIPPVQNNEMRKIFFAAFGQMLSFLSNDIKGMTEIESLTRLQDMNTQYVLFFDEQFKNQ